MKIVTKRDGKFTWIALKDKEGNYYCWFNNSIKGKNIILPGNLYLTNGYSLPNIKNILREEGHK